MSQILKFIIETFDLKTNDTFRKIVGTGLTVLALIYGIFQAAAALLGLDVPTL